MIEYKKQLTWLNIIKDNIIPELMAFSYIFDKSGIKAILDDIKPKDMNSFDKKELEDNLSKSKRDEIQKKIQAEGMVKILRDAKRIYGIDFKALKSLECGSEMDFTLMSKIANSTLNNMEFFAMHFTHKTADDSVVYQSLHQTYIKFVQLFYYNISINNMPDGQQYFTNIIELYKLWYKRNVCAKNKITETGRRSVKHGAKVDDLRKKN